MKKVSCKARPRGFTLIELLIVMSIVGILSGVAIVNYSRSWMDQRLLSTTRDLENWLNKQRRDAIKNSLTTTISFDAQNKKLISSSGSSFDLRESFGNKHEKLSMTSTTNVDPSNEVKGIHFSFRGLSQNHQLTPNGTLELRLKLEGLSTERCIRIISPVGMIRDGSAADSASACRYQSTY
jgi:prepilin-type N-terminal cleavage/methylation domain-containing protein